MSEQKVVVEFTKKDGTAFASEGNWYNLPEGKTISYKLKGQEVTIFGIVKKGKTSFDIKGYKQVSSGNPGQAQSQGGSNKDVQIVNQNSLRHATALVSAGKVPLKDLTKTAERLTDWVFSYKPKEAEQPKPKQEPVQMEQPQEELETPYDDEIPF